MPCEIIAEVKIGDQRGTVYAFFGADYGGREFVDVTTTGDVRMTLLFSPAQAADMARALLLAAQKCCWGNSDEKLAERAVALLRRVPLGDESGHLDPLEADIHAYLTEIDTPDAAVPNAAIPEEAETDDDISPF